MNRKKILKYSCGTLISFIIIANVVAGFHAYKFTHFDPGKIIKTKNPDKIRFGEKIKALVFGVNNPRPINKFLPQHPFETITLKSNKRLECWLIRPDSSLGTVIIFHGFGGQKSSMLDKADIFLSLGYSTLLVDFMGSGGSEGNQTTIGFYEAREVKDAFEFVKNKGEKNIILFGTSMGAAAIMRAQKEYAMNSSALIIECPFGTMVETVQARFKAMHVPAFPMANLLVFWGGLENRFNAFSHNPVEYAKDIYCPTLLLYGEKDIDVSQKETNQIFENLRGIKELQTYPLSGHENYLKKYKEKWIKDVSTFLERSRSSFKH